MARQRDTGGESSKTEIDAARYVMTDLPMPPMSPHRDLPALMAARAASALAAGCRHPWLMSHPVVGFQAAANAAAVSVSQ